jgi:hypothetical protein
MTAALLSVLPAMAIAETQLERLEDLSERMNAAVFDAMIRMAENEGANPEPLRAAIPDGTWDDAYREAGACMLDRFNTVTTASEIDRMLDTMEVAIAQMATTNLDEIGDEFDFLPEGVTEDMSVQINMECGMTELMMQRMEDSGFTAAMMQSMMEN